MLAAPTVATLTIADETGRLPEFTSESLADLSWHSAIGGCEGAFWTTGIQLGGRLGGSTAALMNTAGHAGGTFSPDSAPLLSGMFAANFGEQ